MERCNYFSVSLGKRLGNRLNVFIRGIWFVFILSWCKGEISLWRISGIVLNVHLDLRCRLIDIEVWLKYHKSLFLGSRDFTA